MEDALKAVCALVFALISLPAFAQAPDVTPAQAKDVTTGAPYYSDDCFEEFTEHAASSIPTVAGEPMIEKGAELADVAESAAITAPDHPVDIASGAIDPSEEPVTSAQSIEAAPSENLGEIGEEVDDVAVTGSPIPAYPPDEEEIAFGGHEWWP
jgi:hypothetical protein